MASCERTEYSEDFSGDRFEKIERGDSFDKVESLLGKPISCYLYPDTELRKGELDDGTHYRSLRWNEVESFLFVEETIVELHYSAQIHPKTSYRYCSVRLREGIIFDKTWHLITE